MSDIQETSPRRWFSVRWLVIGVVLGALLTGGIWMAAWMVLNRQSAPLLTQATFDAAWRRWQQAGPRNYDMDVMVSGRREAEIHVEVRDGKVEVMTYNGRTPPSRESREAWTVKGQLNIIQTELTNAKKKTRQAFGVEDPAQVVLRAKFDPELGFPRRYLRVVMDPQRSPADKQIAWEVTRFEAK